MYTRRMAIEKWMPMWMKGAKAWEKQLYALNTVVKRKDQGTGLWMEMGTGKTRVMTEALEYFKVNDNVKFILVVAPLGVLHVWVENFNDWVQEPVLFFDLHELGSAGIRKAAKMASEGCRVVCLCNYESAWKIGHKYKKHIRDGEEVNLLDQVDTALYDFDWDAVVLDEITAIKNPSSKVSKFFVKKIRPKAKFRFGLSGSAYIKRPTDVFAPLKFLTGEEAVPRNMTTFKAMYTVPNPYVRGAIVGYQNIPHLVKKMSKCCVLLKKEEVLDLPPVLHTKRYVHLPPKCKKLYKEITQEMFAELIDFENNGGTVTATHIFSIIQKQLQIASGYVRPDQEPGSEEKPVPLRLHDEKVKQVIEILELREGKPTVLVVQTNEMEKMLVEAIEKNFTTTDGQGKEIPFKPKVLNGKVKGAEARYNMVRDAAEDMCFIVKESVGCEGMDMRWADMMVFVEHRPNTDDYEQMCARNHRGGQTMKITYVHILCFGTRDMWTMEILDNDKKMAEAIERNWKEMMQDDIS